MILISFCASFSCLAGEIPDTSSAKVTSPQPFDNSFDAVELTRKMGNGINLGNTLEAYRGNNPTNKNPVFYETLWGQPETKPYHFKAFADAGFKCVRIPIAWTNMMNYEKNDFTIATALLDRVEDVVNMALDCDLYVVINDHWDGGWWGLFGSKNEAHRATAFEMYKSMWTQIANRFKNYSEKLIFEGGNEEIGDRLNDENALTNGAKDVLTVNQRYECANKINQCFVDTVRSTGANNAQRFLLIPGYDTDIEKTNDKRFKMPQDALPGRLMISVHYYTPSDYCILDKDASWAKCKTTWGTEFEKKSMKQNFAKMKNFVDNGYGVIIGEYAVALRNENGKYTKKNGTELWLKNVLDNCDEYDYCPFLWDCSSLFSRKQNRLGFDDPEIAALYKNRN